MDIHVRISRKVFLPHYAHLINSDADIDFLWGGRDTGKSYFIGSRMVVDCLQLPYFHGILIRKVGLTIKDSQFQIIKNIIHAWGLQSLFVFRESPLSITCANGNKFIARGCDNPENMKSITDPTHAWYEECNQLTREDFIIISTTLRSNSAKVKQYCSFNPETKGDYKKHWLYPWFSEQYQRGVMTFVGEKVIRIPNEPDYVLRYTSTHGTYKVNPHCKPERRAALEELKYIDPYYYRVFTLGLWGNKKNERPFVMSYDPKKHKGRPELNRDEVVWLSFDFNKDPMCVSVIQHYDEKVRVLRTIKLPNSDIFEVCNYVKALYGGCMFLVTGDASGSNRTAYMHGNSNFYTIIMSMLGLNTMHLRVPESNPRLEKNRMLINAVLALYDVEVHEDDADGLISDFENVEVRPDGSIKKEDRDDPDQQADALDTWRYFCNVEMKGRVHYIDDDSETTPDDGFPR